MPGRALDRAEGAVVELGQLVGIGLALDEKAYAQALATVGRQHQRLAEVVDRGRVAALGQERLLELGRLVHQRQAGGGADHLAAVQRQHHQAAPGLGVVAR
jgi:hypothetical protein